MTLLVQRDGTDVGTFFDVFEHGYHRPLRALDSPEFIVDLGSHAGYTLVDFADTYPTAVIVGAEMDPDNYLIAIKNTVRYGRRVTVDRTAVWDRNGECGYSGVASNAYQPNDGSGTPCCTLDVLLERHSVTVVDYLKMDVEGAEASILKLGGAWPDITKQIGVELHPGYDISEARRDLEALGFEVVTHPTHPSALVGMK